MPGALDGEADELVGADAVVVEAAGEAGGAVDQLAVGERAVGVTDGDGVGGADGLVDDASVQAARIERLGGAARTRLVAHDHRQLRDPREWRLDDRRQHALVGRGDPRDRPRVTRPPSWTFRSMTRPASGGSTFTVVAGSASTTAGSTSLRWISFSATASTASLTRNGDPSGTVMRDPSGTTYCNTGRKPGDV